ncbi:MAG: 50S ribosomal protein L29 [Candidatus Brockarchaeota archaeon]|nr:50S ribosomal protein L29 [Candidatus Brockarchaeota archaeon]
MDEKDRKERLQELRTELRNLKMGSSAGHVDDPGRLRETRRAIARFLTVERELAGNAGKKR